MMYDHINKKINKWQSVLLPLFVSLVAVVIAFLFLLIQKNRILAEKQNDLAAIINLKVKDIEDWRNEHFRDARILAGMTGFNSLMIDFLEGRKSDTILKNILQRISENYDYHSIFLVDSDNNIRFSTDPDDLYKKYPSEDLAPDLRLASGSEMAFMDIPIILQDEQKDLSPRLILRIDPQVVLFPQVQSWPAQSKTSETLLLRREGDSILYLNDLRHSKGSTLRLKLSATDPELPGAMAARGYEGFFEGRDYRGVKVVSYLKRIPDSQWYMVAKVDKAEIYTHLKEQILLVSIIVLLTITTFIIFIRLYLGNQRLNYLKELNRTRDTLYSIISHDLKNPFVSIMGFSEMLYERSLKNDFSRTTEFTTIIYSSSRSAMDLLHNLIGWTRLQTGKAFYNPIDTDLILIINHAVDFARPTALMKSILIKINAPGELRIKADREMVGTILRNLVINAIKFSFKDSVITISVKKAGKLAEIEVADSGTGMDDQTISKLLNQEFTKSTPGTSNELGTGLGLYVCKEFIGLHNGTLNIISEPGQGSRFIVKLPMNS